MSSDPTSYRRALRLELQIVGTLDAVTASKPPGRRCHKAGAINMEFQVLRRVLRLGTRPQMLGLTGHRDVDLGWRPRTRDSLVLGVSTGGDEGYRVPLRSCHLRPSPWIPTEVST